MRAAANSLYPWPRPSSPLPRAKDFDPYNGDLDRQHALDIFGGMTLDQAYEEFCDRPEIYQEDFLCMGPKAFVYYFPVISRYLREITSNDPHEDCEVAILAYAIKEQLNYDAVRQSIKILSEIRSLIDFVLAEVARYSGSKKIRKKLHTTWTQLAEKLAKCEHETLEHDAPRSRSLF